MIHPEMTKDELIDHLIKSREAAMAVCRAYVSDYEDTFISPDEMTGESKDIYEMAKAALALE